MSDRSQTGSSEAPLCVGRERELAALEGVVSAMLSDERGRLALVAGPAGIGKSRLLQELRRRLQGRAVAFLEGRARDGARAYQPLVEAISAAVRAVGELGAAELSVEGADLLARLRGRTEEGLVDPMPDGADRAGAGTVELLRVAFHERVACFLTDVSRRIPLVLVVHDLHAADAATRGVLAHLARTRCPAPEIDVPVEDRMRGVLVYTSREVAPAWLDIATSVRLELGALDAGGILDYLRSPEVVRLVTEATGGRPQALRALLSSPPVDASELFEMRRARLSDGARSLLGALALHGRPASPALLRAIELASGDAATNTALPISRSLPRAERELVEGRLVDRRVVDGELHFVFAKEGDRDAAVRALSVLERSALHRAIGRALIALGNDDDRVTAAEHLCLGDAGDEAVGAALSAAQRLETSFGYERALGLYRDAHRLTTDETIRARIEERLVDLGRLTGNYAAALTDAHALLARHPDDAATLRTIGQLHLLSDDYGRAHAALARARAISLRDGNAVELPRVIAAVAETCLLDGRHTDAIAECEIGLLATDDASAGPEAARHRLEIRNTLGKVHLADGRYPAADALFTQNLDQARALGIAFEQARALINQGIARLRLGDEARAAESYQAALKIAHASGDHRHRAFCLQNLGVLAHWSQQFSAALGYFQDAIAAFNKIGQSGRVAWVALDLASLYLDLGAIGRGRGAAAMAERLMETGVAAAVHLKRDIVRGRVARGTGDLDEARRHLEAARSAARPGGSEFHAEASLQLGWLELEAGRCAVARDLASALAAGAPMVSQATRARAQLLAGEIDLAEGRAVPARRALLEAAESFHLLEDLEGEWRSHFALSRAALLAGDLVEAERRLRRAVLVDGRLLDRVPDELQAEFVADPTRRSLKRSIATLEPPNAPEKTTSISKPAASFPSTETAATEPDRYQGIIGRNARMRQIYALVEKVARHQSVVLIRGESGTGKELIAGAIHARSPRAAQAIVRVNCGALVESLLLSELFGHERGAFTGAVQRQKGRFEAAHLGTIFLDEIGDISPRTQTALLRVIQERQFERVGSTTPIKVDVRIICATNRDLEAMVARGEFREDLYYRLQGIQIDLPPLRERTDDIPLLVGDLLRRVAEERGTEPKAITPPALALLTRHRWPGNVRELENVIRSVSLLSDEETISAANLVEHHGFLREAELGAGARSGNGGTAHAGRATTAGSEAKTTGAGGTETAWERLGTEGIGLRELQDKIEIECITRALAESRGNITRAAELLKMKRPRLSQLIKEHGIAL